MAQQCAQLEETRAGSDGPDRPVCHEQEARIHENMDCELSQDAPVQENSEAVSSIFSIWISFDICVTMDLSNA